MQQSLGCENSDSTSEEFVLIWTRNTEEQHADSSVYTFIEDYGFGGRLSFRFVCLQEVTWCLQRWNFPFKSLEIAKLYVRTADYTVKKSCGIYKISSGNGRVSYKIFASKEDLRLYLKKNKDKTCNMISVFAVEEYKEYKSTQIRKLSSTEIQMYLSEPRLTVK